MEAVDEAQAASQSLQQEANQRTFALFRERMQQLEQNLQRPRTVPDNEEAFAMDELMDALSRVYSGHTADYRKTQRMTE